MTAPVRRSRKASFALGALALAVAALAGCGVPVDRGPTALSRTGVPFHLLDPSAPSTTTTTLTSPVEVPEEIFLFGPAGVLVAVSRAVPSSPSSQDLLATILGALVDGPTEAETALGLQSAVPPQTSVLGASIGPGGVATVDLAGAFAQLVGQAQIQAVAQIVYTATTLPSGGVTQVTFQIAGTPIEVPVASGAQVPIVNRSDFATFAPQPATRGGATS